ncbi:MAG: 3D domain-containing protein [Akkermansiaceae bacterium]
MRKFSFFISSALAVVCLLSSCSQGLKGISKASSRTLPYAKVDPIVTEAPAAHLVAAAHSKPKDRHNMPVYAFGERNRLVRTTAYTCSEDDHLQYGSANAFGTTLKYNNRVRSAAADWSFYPLGTVFKIKGQSPLYVVDDYGSALTGTGTIDIYHPTRDWMNAWGRRNVEIVVVQWGSLERSAEVLSKRTHHPHCRRMFVNIQRMRGLPSSTAMR